MANKETNGLVIQDNARREWMKTEILIAVSILLVISGLANAAELPDARDRSSSFRQQTSTGQTPII